MELIFEGDIVSDEIQDFCDKYNSLNRPYSLAESNCQNFVDDLLVELAISSKFRIRINHAVKGAIAFSKASCAAISGTLHSTVFDSLIIKAFSKKIINSTITSVAPDIGQIAVTQLSNEAAESLASVVFRGVFTPWQLLQIPAELLTR